MYHSLSTKLLIISKSKTSFSSELKFHLLISIKVLAFRKYDLYQHLETVFKFMELERKDLNLNLNLVLG